MKRKVLVVMLSVTLLAGSSVMEAFAAGTDVSAEENITDNIVLNADTMNVVDDTDISADEVEKSEIADAEEAEKPDNTAAVQDASDGETDIQAEEHVSGVLGDNLTWELSSDGTLTISGEGEMQAQRDEWGYTTYPWGAYVISDVIIEDGVTSIGEGAFLAASELKSVEIPNSVTSIGYQAFQMCTGLTSILIPDSVTNIGALAFNSCEGLTEISIPNSVTNIGWRAFQLCNALETVNLPENLEVIEDSLFWGCSNLKEIDIPAGVTEIGESAFENCRSLTDITIPASVTAIGRSAFDGTPWKDAALSENGLLIVNNILAGSANDSELITLPANLISITGGVFQGNTNLKQIAIPDSVSSIGEFTFDDCTNLSDVNIPDSLTSIQYGLFYNCESLTSVEIPRGVTSIGGRAFFNTGLTSITIPKSVTEIEEAGVGYEGEPDQWGEYWDLTPVEGFTIYGYAGTAAETYANENSFTFVALTEPKLEIVPERTDEVYVKGSGQDVVIYCTGEFADFVSVEMDGVLVDPSNYTVEDGSTVLTFASSYLDTLSVGRHTVTLNYIDDSISTYLTIVEENAGGTNTGTGSGAGTGNGTSGSGSGGIGNSGQIAAGGTVRTGDQSAPTLWMVLGLISLAACAGVAVVRKKI